MKQANDVQWDRRELLKALAALPAAPALAQAQQQPPGAAAAGADGAALPAPMLEVGVPRKEGVLKVTGAARYATEHPQKGMLFGVMVQSTVAAGSIESVDAGDALAAPGVVAVYTHLQGLQLRAPQPYAAGGAATEKFVPFQDALVRFNGQHVGAVIAQTLEQATHAAGLLRFVYAAGPAVIGMDDPQARQQPLPTATAQWGDAVGAMARAPHCVKAAYRTPREYNVPMELHGCIAQWQGDELTVWEPSQWVGGARRVISEWLDHPIEKIHVVSPYVGGGFGSKVAPHPHVAVACAAARQLGRPVKLTLTRQQTFTGYGGRAATEQQLALGATAEGRLTAIVQEGWNETAIDDINVEKCNAVTTTMYAVPHLSSRHSLRAVHTVNPSWLRAPGENPSAFALETAMDELAHRLQIDPIELRLRNWAGQDPHHRIPWTTRRLREAYAAGAQAFGWSHRNPQPRSMHQGRELIGWGMAGGTYPVRRTPGEARVVLWPDGRVEVHSSGADIGTGTYTILAQTAADALGVPLERIQVLLGDTALPRAPLAGGSQLANVLTGAVHKACMRACEELTLLAARHPASPLRGADPSRLRVHAGMVGPADANTPGGRVRIDSLLSLAGRDRLVAMGDTFPAAAGEKEKDAADQTFTQMQLPTAGGLSAHSWSAQFVEVRVDEDLGTVRVRRMVGAFDSGRVYNPRLARSQWVGGMVMGLGQALFEEGLTDPRDGRVLNANLADYVVAVNADVPEIMTISVGQPDYAATVLGGKAVGELGIVGVAAAISNAVFHATGKRVRELPITLDKLV